MNRVELSVTRQMSAETIEPLGFTKGAQPVSCTPVAVAALAIAAAGTAYYAFRDYKTHHSYTYLENGMEALGGESADENHMSVSDLTGAVRDLQTR